VEGDVTPQEALDRIAALFEDDVVYTESTLRAVLAEVSPEPVGGVLDRDQARAVLRSAYRDDPSEDPEGFEEILDRLAAAVRPAAIDRDALVAAIRTFPWAMSAEDAADRLITLALVRPVAGVTLTPEEAEIALGWEARVSAEWGPERTAEEQALVDRLEAIL
jgi:hypothetical protein